MLLRDVQMHPFRNEILHVDFQRVDENRKIHMKVPLHFVNGEISPAVKARGAIVSHVHDRARHHRACRRTCRSSSRSTCRRSTTGHSIHVSALKLPPGVTVGDARQDDPVVATAVMPKAQVETEEEPRRGRGRGRSGARRPQRRRTAPRAAEREGGDKKDEKKDDKKDDKKK